MASAATTAKEYAERYLAAFESEALTQGAWHIERDGRQAYAGIDIAEHFGREFDRLASHVSLCIHSAGLDHAALVAKDLAGLSHDPVTLLNVAKARATGDA